jgi:hypothetical protein
MAEAEAAIHKEVTNFLNWVRSQLADCVFHRLCVAITPPVKGPRELTTACLSLNELFQDLGQHTSASLTEICNCVQRHKIHGSIVALDQQLPSPARMSKLKKSGEFGPIVHAKIEVAEAFQQPFSAVTQCHRFFTAVLGLLPPTDSRRAMVDLVRSEFVIFDENRRFQQLRQQYSEQLERLVAAGKGTLDLDQLHLYSFCAGFILRGTIERPERQSAHLFFFKEFMALHEITCAAVRLFNYPDLWVVPISPIFGGEIVDILGTKMSFAFEPADRKAFLAAWTAMACERCRDFTEYQPVTLSGMPLSFHWTEVQE